MYNKIYVFSFTHLATGGTELLQQLVYKLRHIGLDAYMVYTTPYHGSKVEQVFGPRYNNPYVCKIEDCTKNMIIVHEAAIHILLNYKYVHKAVWWLSVDFYGGSFRIPTDYYHKIFYSISDYIFRKYDKKWIHFVQSEYAYNYCIRERNIPAEHVVRLSDYLSKAFVENAIEDDGTNRENQVLYNPKRGLDFTKSLMSLAPEIKWIPIINMTSQQIAELMRTSKVYIDFGNHPGKDRIPREAAIQGCCIITGKRGAAANFIDVPISTKYKYEENEAYKIIDAIKGIFDNYVESRKDFLAYVEKIKKEEFVFEEEIKGFFIEREVLTVHHSTMFLIIQCLMKEVVYAMKFTPSRITHFVKSICPK